MLVRRRRRCPRLETGKPLNQDSWSVRKEGGYRRSSAASAHPPKTQLWPLPWIPRSGFLFDPSFTPKRSAKGDRTFRFTPGQTRTSLITLHV